MSSFYGKAINPKTNELENAEFLDNYFGRHKYGVRFSDGSLYRENDVNTMQSTNYTGSSSSKRKKIKERIISEMANIFLISALFGGILEIIELIYTLVK